VTTRQVTVVQHADTGVLVHRVETALVVSTLRVARGWPADDGQLWGSRVQDGKLVERWGRTDHLGFLQQLGIVPAMST
jgi:hypothetical protein